MRFLTLPFRSKDKARKGRPLPLARMLRAGAAVLSLASVIGGGAWLLRSGIWEKATGAARAQTIAISADAGLRIREITVEGRHRTKSDAILIALGLERGHPLLGFDIAEAQKRVKNLPWVKTATLERRWPGLVHVRLTEKEPIALWQRQGKHLLVDKDGSEIEPDREGRFAHLPVIVGSDAPRHAAQLFDLLAEEATLFPRVKAAIRISERRWNVKLDDVDKGIEVKLPEEDASGAWRRLAQLEREHRILANRLAAIDLRQSDRLVIQPAAPAKAEPAAQTPNIPKTQAPKTEAPANKKSAKEA